jgi:hypothetical protein
LIEKIEPDLGTTAGGTEITITGKNFFDSKADTVVTIDGINCPISSINAEKT